MKRPQFIIFTDKDGTLNLEDKQLNKIFNLIGTMGGMVIPITGRTVGDIEENIKQQKVRLPDFIIGDNGANIYSTTHQTFVDKKLLNHEKVMNIIDEFLKNGGNKDHIRYTDGVNIFASDQKEVKQYYRKSKTIKLCEDIYEALQQNQDITKITIVGSKEQIQHNAEFIKKLDFWTDMDVTNFPKKKYHNYRLDISQKDINKGEAVKTMVEKLHPTYGYLCVGNGYNDVSMFKTAIDDNMIVAIMNDASWELKQEVIEYSRMRKKGKVMIIPKSKDLANQYILKMAKIFQSHIKTEEGNIPIRKRLPNVPRVKVKGIDSVNIKYNTGLRRGNKER